MIEAFQTVMTENGLADFDFQRAFRTWELQPGFPVIRVSFGGSVRGLFYITQERFFTKQHAVKDNFHNWYIPLNYATELNPNFEDTKFSEYFVDGEDLFIIDAPAQLSSGQWYVFNKQQLGYYRVNYDNANWQALIKVLNSENYWQIHVLNRAQLVDDSLNLALSGYLDYDIAFGILSYLVRETEYTPWISAYRFFDQLYARFGTTNNELNVS